MPAENFIVFCEKYEVVPPFIDLMRRRKLPLVGTTKKEKALRIYEELKSISFVKAQLILETLNETRMLVQHYFFK